MKFLREPTGGIWFADGVDPATDRPILWPVPNPEQWSEYARAGYTFTQMPAAIDWRWWTDGRTITLPTGGGGGPGGPVDLTPAALDAVEERAFAAVQKAEDE